MSKKDNPKETPKEPQGPVRPEFPKDRIEKGEKPKELFLADPLNKMMKFD